MSIRSSAPTAGRAGTACAVGTTFDDRYRVRRAYFGTGPSGPLAGLFRRLAADGGGRALDLGAGDGRNSLFLARQGFDVTAVDASAAGLRHLETTARAEDLSVSTVCSDIRNTQFGVKRWDLVVCVTVLGFLEASELPDVARRAIDAMRSGGCLAAEEFTRQDPGFHGEGPASEFAHLVRRFFGPGELKRLFRPLETERYREFSVLDTTHGRPHRHGLVRYIGRKR